MQRPTTSARWLTAGLFGLAVVVASVGLRLLWVGAANSAALLLFASAAGVTVLSLRLLSATRLGQGDVTRQRAMLNALAEGVVVYDREGRVDFENHSAQVLLSGRTQALLGGRGDDGFVDEAGQPLPVAQRAPVRALREGRPVLNQIIGIQGPDASTVWMRVHSTPVPSKDGRLSSVVVNLTDMTEERTTRARLADSERKFRELLDATRESIVIHRGFQMLYANGAFESSFGRETDAWAQLFAENRRPLFDGRFRDALETGVTTRYRREAVTSKDGPTWVDMLTRRTTWAGRPALQSNLLDVTAQVRAESAAKAQEVAEAEARSKSQMLANMSHELRTPMTGVLGMADLLLQTTLDGEQHRLLTGLRSSADLLLTLVDDVLDFSRLEADVVRLESVDFDPRRAADTVFQLLEPKSRQKNIGLSCSVDPSVPAALRGDPVRLQQILFNLVGNAIKFTDEGRVEVRMRSSVQDKTAQLLVEIQDTGVGIAPDRIPTLFERWDQGDERTRERFGGNGLGLTISQRLCQLMGGDIGIQSERGRGSTFSVSLVLPIGEVAAVDAAPKPIVPLGWAKGLSLLLAEDEEVNRTMLTMLLEAEGFQVTAVEDGARAVEAARQRAFDLVVLDMHMPVLSGSEAARAIHSIPHCSGPVLGLTADAEPEHRGRYRSVGIQALLTKPFDRNDFAWTAQKLLEARPTALPPLISEERLEHLATHLGQHRLDELFEKFRHRVRDEVESLEVALLRNEPEALAEARHRLSGCAANFGADRLSATAQGLGPCDDERERAQKIDRLQRCLEDTLQEMDARLTRPHHERQ